jgi:arginine metabolism regulation protein II
MCVTADLRCSGCEKNIFFDFDGPHTFGEVRFRRPLLTDEERACMSKWLTTIVPPRKAL